MPREPGFGLDEFGQGIGARPAGRFAGPRGAIGLALLAVAFWGTVAWFAELRSDVVRSGVGGFARDDQRAEVPRVLDDEIWEAWPPAPPEPFHPGWFGDPRPRPLGLAYGSPSMLLTGQRCPRRMPSLMAR